MEADSSILVTFPEFVVHRKSIAPHSRLRRDFEQPSSDKTYDPSAGNP
jgi:hypothetical protein